MIDEDNMEKYRRIQFFQTQDIVTFLSGQPIYCVVFLNSTLIGRGVCQVFLQKK